jgi:DNA-binding NarL/FixJ family response regulator
MADRPIRVVLVDDHPMLREGTAALLAAQGDIAVVGQTGRGAEALGLVAESGPDVLVLDLHLPDLGGVEVARQVRAAHPGVAILVLSNYEDPMYVRALLQLGARGYLGKSTRGEEIVAAVRAVARGGATVLSDGARASLGAGGATLSARESEILGLIAAGRRNAQIAGDLSIAESTVEYHVRHILTKLDAHSRTDALRKAREQGLMLTISPALG